MMRTSLRAGAAAVGALTVALTAGAFASLPGSGTVAAPSHGSAPALASLRPGTPARAVSGGQVQAAATLANSVTAKQSSNWAGYAAYNGTTTFRLVSAHFTVPYLDCNGVTATDGAWSSHWVGLGSGWTAINQPLWSRPACLQAATAALRNMTPGGRCTRSSPIYPSITVHAGNAIDMSVYYHSTTHQFTLNFSDTTNAQKFSKTVSCPPGPTCHRNSAEVISEAPYDTQISNLTPLADFQAASFTNAHITNTSGTHSGGFRSSGWNTYAITQISDGSNPDLAGTAIPAGTALDRPTPLYQNVTFLDYWMPANAK